MEEYNSNKKTQTLSLKMITVCSNCFARLDKCNCKCTNKHSFFVDKNIQPILEILNNKGYKTLYSCESHTEISPYDFCMYIMFKEPIPKELQNIKDFSFEKKNTIIQYLITDVEKKSIIELVKEKEIHLKMLYNWSKSLPNKTGDLKNEC